GPRRRREKEQLRKRPRLTPRCRRPPTAVGSSNRGLSPIPPCDRASRQRSRSQYGSVGQRLPPCSHSRNFAAKPQRRTCPEQHIVRGDSILLAPARLSACAGSLAIC